MTEKSYCIGMGGGTASGKTSICKLLKKSLGNDILVLSMDSFYLGLPAEMDSRDYNFDHPDAIDWPLLLKIIEKLKAGFPVNIPIYDFVTHQRRKEKEFKLPKKCIVIEGIHALGNTNLLHEYDYKVYIDTPTDIRLLRRITRDSIERGRDLLSIGEQYLKTVRSSHELYVEPTKGQANIIIPYQNRNTEGVETLITRIEKKIY